VATARLLLEEGKIDDARTVSEDVTRVGSNFVKTRDVAVGLGERSEWLRAFKAFEVMASELRGLITMAGPKGDRGGAYNWYQSAAERQTRMTLMTPPSVLLPMEARLGEYYMDRSENEKAVEALQAGLKDWPNDRELMVRLLDAYKVAGMEQGVAEMEGKLKALEAQ
jgi:hypothetical protein